MGREIKKDPFIIEHIALRSAQWDTDERLKFIWDNTLIVGHYERDYKRFNLLTRIDAEEELKVKDWFYRMTHQGKLGEETEENVQENWD